MRDESIGGLAAEPRSVTCLACGYHVAVPFYDGGAQPLTTLGWPASAEEARSMTRLPHDYVRCVDCGHVWNAVFPRLNPYPGELSSLSRLTPRAA